MKVKILSSSLLMAAALFWCKQQITNADPRPIDKRDTIKLNRGVLPIFPSSLVNFNYVLETGQVPGQSFTNFYIDWKSQDDFTYALRMIELNVLSRVRLDKGMRVQMEALINYPGGRGFRQVYEGMLAQMVVEEIEKWPGFQKYRTSNAYEGAGPDTKTNARDIRRLNDLSSDIRNDTDNLRFDCVIKSIVVGVIIQRVENIILPSQRVPNEFARPLSYFYVPGDAIINDDQRTALGHAVIFTPAGGIIDSQSSEPYKDGQLNASLERLVRGNLFFSQLDNSFYNMNRYDSRPSDEVVRLNRKGTMPDNRDDLDYLYYRRLIRRSWYAVSITETPDKDFILMSFHYRKVDKLKGNKDIYEIKAFQLEMKSTVDEQYALVAYQATLRDAGSQPPTLSAEYKDILTGKSYRFTSQFDGRGVADQIVRETTVFGVDIHDERLATKETPYQRSNLYRKIYEIPGLSAAARQALEY